MKWRVDLSLWAITGALLLVGCGGPHVSTGRFGAVNGEVQVTAGSRGSAWLFLYPPGLGPPLSQALPEQVTAVPDVRLAEGDGSFRFSNVEPNPYRLWAFLDVNGDFQTEVDVLGGPGAGDRISEGIEFNLQPGEHRRIELPIRQHVYWEPPAFSVNGASSEGAVQLPDQPAEIVSLQLSSTPLGLLRPDRTGFVVGMGDADDDGVADDANADGIPDLFPQIYLRFLRRPGQVVPLDRLGSPAEVIVPLAFDPGPFLAALALDPSQDVVVDTLQTFLVPQAQAITFEPGRGRVVTPMDAIPVGEYELWVVSESGQFWRVPNDLGTEAAAALGGPHDSQRTRFLVVHGSTVGPSEEP